MNGLTGGGPSVLLTDWWLPQLNFVSFWIYDPSKLSVFGVVDAQMAFLPSLKRGRVFGFEEDAADTSDSLHIDL